MNKPVILCVDDEQLILNCLKIQILSEFRDYCYCETAESANDAFSLIDELQEDKISIIVIVSDWLMPGMKGDEFLVEVHKKYPRVIKVLLTGQAEKEAIERARMHANLHALITKPWSKDELILSIKSGMNLI